MSAPATAELKRVLETGAYAFKDDATVPAYINQKLDKAVERYNDPEQGFARDMYEYGWSPNCYGIPSYGSVVICAALAPMYVVKEIPISVFRQEGQDLFGDVSDALDGVKECLAEVEGDELEKPCYTLMLNKYEFYNEDGGIQDGEACILHLPDVMSAWSDPEAKENLQELLKKTSEEGCRLGDFCQYKAIELLNQRRERGSSDADRSMYVYPRSQASNWALLMAHLAMRS